MLGVTDSLQLGAGFDNARDLPIQMQPIPIPEH